MTLIHDPEPWMCPVYMLYVTGIVASDSRRRSIWRADRIGQTRAGRLGRAVSGFLLATIGQEITVRAIASWLRATGLG
jgi:hypothetical protein